MTSNRLTCEACGESAAVVLTTPDGETVTVEEYREAARMAGAVILCDRCAAMPEDGA